MTDGRLAGHLLAGGEVKRDERPAVGGRVDERRRLEHVDDTRVEHRAERLLKHTPGGAAAGAMPTAERRSNDESNGRGTL